MPKFIQFQVVNESFDDVDGTHIPILMMYALSSDGEMWSAQSIAEGWTSWEKIKFDIEI